MSDSINVVASHSRVHTIERDATQLPSLKEEIAALCGGRVRRVDRYIELCLLGALNCVAGRRLPTDTAVYLATRSGAVDTSAEATKSIVQLQQPPKPLHFVNTLGNTACFYLTQNLNIHGQALVVSQEHLSFEAALFQACIDIKLGVVQTALVGGIDEVTLPITQHAKRLGAPDAERLLEGSHWLLLSNDTASGTAGIAMARPEFRQDLQAMGNWLKAQADGPVQCSFAPSEKERRLITSHGRSIITAGAAQRYQAIEHGVYSGATLVALMDSQKAEQQNVATPGGTKPVSSIHLARTDDTYCGVVVTVN